mgnify:FL=1
MSARAVMFPGLRLLLGHLLVRGLNMDRAKAGVSILGSTLREAAKHSREFLPLSADQRSCCVRS